MNFYIGNSIDEIDIQDVKEELRLRETKYLSNISGMTESIIEDGIVPLSECTEYEGNW